MYNVTVTNNHLCGLQFVSRLINMCAMTAEYFPLYRDIWKYTCSLRSAFQTEHILSLELTFNMSSTWQDTKEGLERTPWAGCLVNSCNPSSVSEGTESCAHKSCNRSRQPQTPLSPRTRTGTPGANKTNVFILNGKPRGVYQDEGSAASGAALFVPLYFNKHQTQTRLGASSLQNVREGSAISHNKWAHANSGVFTMHNSVFGEHCSDAGRWYAIILKSIRIRARAGRCATAALSAAFVFPVQALRKERSRNNNHRRMLHVSDWFLHCTEDNNSKCKIWIVLYSSI